MAVNNVRLFFVVTCLLATYTQAQRTADSKFVNNASQNISQNCFGCICEAISGCDTTSGCSEDVCGPFRITWEYWADSGKPTLDDKSNNNKEAFSRCVNEPLCAARAIQGYMNKYAQDCNRDGVINCDDYIRIHRHGGFDCDTPLPRNIEDPYQNCVRSVGQ